MLTRTKYYPPFLQTAVNCSTVFNEDCMQTMARYSDGYFDLAVCDIPYGINLGNMAFLKETKTTVKQKNGVRLNPNKNKKVYTSKDWDLETPSQEYFNELKRISKHQIIFGVEYVNWECLGNGRIKWNKGVAEGMSFKPYEMAYCSIIDYEMEINLLWAGMQQAKSITEPMTQQGNKKLNEKRIDPCHKPIVLYDIIYQTFGFDGMKIIDTHLGGGSNRISADKFGFEFVASEIDDEYFEKQEKRFSDYKKTSFLPFT